MLRISESKMGRLYVYRGIRRDTLASLACLFYYLIFVVTFFYSIALPALLRETGVRIGADSHTYIDIARFLEATNQFTLDNAVSLSFNYFGPVLLLLATGYDHTLILLINLLLFLISLISLYKYYDFNRFWFTLLLIFNPITLLSLTTVNKEIFGLSSIIYLLVYMRSKSLKHLAMALVLAFMTRWQQVLFILVFLPYIRIIRENKKTSVLGSLSVLMLISLVYPLIKGLVDFTGDVTATNIKNQFAQAGGLIPFLNNLQDNFMYWAAFIPKALLNYVGNFPRIIRVFDASDSADFYNRMLVGHQICMLIILIVIIYMRKIRINLIHTQIILIYSMLYCISLAINYRYFYPLYPAFLLLVAMKNDDLKSNKPGRMTVSRGS